MEIELQWIVSLKLRVWVWFLFLLLFITHVNSKPLASDDNHPDFISIDCGSDRDYLDEETGIWFQTDEDFVKTGQNHVTSPSVNLKYTYFEKRLKTLRSFPDGVRNCYNLKPKQGKNNSYLIRAFFAYGNYDFKNETPYFDLYIGVNRLETISVNMYYLFSEAIHTPSKDTIDVCLVKTGPTIPYISSLELRPLNNSIYRIMSTSTPQRLLHLEGRLDAGSSQIPRHSRYKDDPYDRTWFHDSLDATNGWYDLNESIDVDSATDAYKLPVQVWRTASRSWNVSYSLNFDFNSLFLELDRNFDYQVYFHFADIEKLPEGKKRIMNITLNSKTVLSHPLVLEYLKPVTISPQDAAQGEVKFSISATRESAAPPILNAFEIYRLMNDLDSPTDTRDVGAILDIKSAYQLSRLTWQGDPCLPKEFAWEGLICNSDINPRITALNLSSSKLTGEIDTSFSYLTELESLDLSDNYLKGPLPEFLAELPKLKFLNLRGNKLSGQIPKTLKEKADTTLQLSVDDNPYLCNSDSCKKKNFVAPIVGSLSTLIVILLISPGFWIIKRRQRVMRTDSENVGSLKSKHRAFSYSEILNIIENFQTVIGAGGFGKVYFGILQDHTEVAEVAFTIINARL